MIDPDIESVAFVRQAFLGWDEPVEFDAVENAELAWDYLNGGETNETGLLPHLLITELELPGETGLDMIVHLKGDSKLSPLPVAVYTSSQDADLISKAYKLKVSCCIPKPSNPDLIPNLVKDLRHFFLNRDLGAKGNPLLEALNNPRKRKQVASAFKDAKKSAEPKPVLAKPPLKPVQPVATPAPVAVEEPVKEEPKEAPAAVAAEPVVEEPEEKTGAERREHKRAGSSLAVHARVFSPAEVGKLIKSLSRPDPNLRELVNIEKATDKMRMACLDISEGGVGTEAHPDLVAGKKFEQGVQVGLAIDMPEGPTPICAVAQVMWETTVRSNLHKAGLMFLAISNEDRERIQKYVDIRVP